MLFQPTDVSQVADASSGRALFVQRGPPASKCRPRRKLGADMNGMWFFWRSCIALSPVLDRLLYTGRMLICLNRLDIRVYSAFALSAIESLGYGGNTIEDSNSIGSVGRRVDDRVRRSWHGVVWLLGGGSRACLAKLA